PLADFLLDDQAAIVPIMLAAKRFACWSDCGLGKTVIGLECGRHIIHRTGGRVLVTTRNNLVDQWIEESEKFYRGALPLTRLTSRAAVRDWCANGPPASMGITNNEKWVPEDRA